MNIRCLWDNVLLLVDRGGVEKKSAGGIVMPATAKQGHRRQGEIVGIGPGKPMFYDGQWVTRPMTVKVGQHITFEIGAGTVYPQDDGKEYIVLVEEQITGIYPTAEEIRAEQEERDITFAIDAQVKKERAKPREQVMAEHAAAVAEGRTVQYEEFANAAMRFRQLHALLGFHPDSMDPHWLPENDAAVRELLHASKFKRAG